MHNSTLTDREQSQKVNVQVIYYLSLILYVTIARFLDRSNKMLSGGP